MVNRAPHTSIGMQLTGKSVGGLREGTYGVVEAPGDDILKGVVLGKLLGGEVRLN
jgi:hypothetical protein